MQNAKAGERKLKEITKKYISEGFHTVESGLPSFISRFQPDLVLKKGDEFLIVEVKTRENLKHSKNLTKLAEEVNRHNGWRLELVVINPEKDSSKFESVPFYDQVDFDELESRLLESKSLFHSKFDIAALLLVWSVIEGTLLIRTSFKGRNLEKVGTLLKDAAVLGIISEGTYAFLKSIGEERNRLVHGLQKSRKITKKEVDRLLSICSSLLSEGSDKALD